MKNLQVPIKGKVALVSGSNRGIGKAITIELLENGAKKVYAGARNVISLDKLKMVYGERLIPIELDVTKDETIENASKIAKDVEILINNAGIFSPGNFLDGNLLESLKTNLDVNVWGLVKLTNAFLEIIRNKKSGSIVNLSSVAGLASMPMALTYSASKAAVHSIIQGLRGELKTYNISVIGVYPGPIDTEMTKSFEMEKDTPENVAKSIIKGIKYGVEDIFPDLMSLHFGETYFASPKATEEQLSNFS